MANIRIGHGYDVHRLTEGRKLIREYDAKFCQAEDAAVLKAGNEALCRMAKKETVSVLNKLMLESSKHMKNGYNLADN